MKPFEDQIQEEQEEEQEQLIVLLRRAYRQKQVLPAREQQEAIARVKEHLEQLEEQGMDPVEQFAEETGHPLVFPKQRGSARKKTLTRVMSALAAVLVVGILIGSFVLLFAPRRPQTYSPHRTAGTSQLAGPPGAPTSVDVQWNGLEMNIRVTPGPYFLGELLAVELSLTNHTYPTVTLGGTRHTSDDLFCSDSSLAPEQNGGTAPHYSLFTTPVQMIIDCNKIRVPGPYSDLAFAPGQTVTGHFYVLLTDSGDVTLTGAAFFYMPPANAQKGAEWQRNSGPLTGHLPVLRIHVTPQAPADRQLSILREDSKSATIQAPAGLHLLAQTYVICQDLDGHLWASGTIWNRDYWQPLSTSVVQRPDCNGSGLTFAQWKYAVGAVGYEVVQGHYSVPTVP
jgi:hypothetical protein